jgi:hypothetical protein
VAGFAALGTSSDAVSRRTHGRYGPDLQGFGLTPFRVASYIGRVGVALFSRAGVTLPRPIADGHGAATKIGG